MSFRVLSASSGFENADGLAALTTGFGLLFRNLPSEVTLLPSPLLELKSLLGEKLQANIYHLRIVKNAFIL